jgi:predicted enzyme related to lactoylglutathione lyase
MTTTTTIGVTLDCNDIVRIARFWREALGYEEEAAPTPDAEFHGLGAPANGSGLHHLTLQQVTEPKSTKNRAHLDLFVDDLDAEVARLVALGATLAQEHHGHFRTSVMTDPEGNEFCVVRRPQPSE